MKNTKVALVGLVSNNTEKYVMVSKCGKYETVIINNKWYNVMFKRLASEKYHKDWKSYTIIGDKVVRLTKQIAGAIESRAKERKEIWKFERMNQELITEFQIWLEELKKVSVEMYDMYRTDRVKALAVMSESVKGYNVSSTSEVPVLKRAVWIAPEKGSYRLYDAKQTSDNIKKGTFADVDIRYDAGTVFVHSEERFGTVICKTDLDYIKNYVQVQYYNILEVEDAKLESESERLIKAVAEEITDINPDWIGHESFEENLVSLMNIKNRVGEEVYQRALELAF